MNNLRFRPVLSLLIVRVKIVGLAVAALAATLLCSAQPATGRVQGRIFNPATGDFVRNAEVRLVGTERVGLL
jgi:hypothetical protein